MASQASHKLRGEVSIMGRDRPPPPVFCGNFEYDAHPREVERLFDKYGPLERVDMKTGFAFVYMRDYRDAEDAIRGLDRREFGYRRRRLRVEWAKGDGEVRKREDLRKRQTKPTTTLFVVNFDVDKTRERDLEKHFEPFGKLRRVQIKRNYAFIQYEDVDQSEDALKACNGTCLAGDTRPLSVEYVAREADGRAIDEENRRRSRSSSPYRGRPRSRSSSYEPRRSPRRSPSPVRGRDASVSRSRSPVRVYSRSRSPVDDRSPSR